MPRAVCGPAPYSARPKAPRIRRRAPAGAYARARHTFRYGGGIRGRIMRGGGMPPTRANLIRPGIMKAPRACRARRIRAFPVRGLAARLWGPDAADYAIWGYLIRPPNVARAPDMAKASTRGSDPAPRPPYVAGVPACGGSDPPIVQFRRVWRRACPTAGHGPPQCGRPRRVRGA